MKSQRTLIIGLLLIGVIAAGAIVVSEFRDASTTPEADAILEDFEEFQKNRD